MKLALYSGGHDFENLGMDKALLDAIGKKNPKFAFIPSCSYLSHLEFREFVSQYRKHKVKKFIHFPIDTPFSSVMKEEVFSGDVIHLSGGNTFYFLKHLRKSKMLSELKKFAERGGVLTGLSAGAIIMTKNINTASFPSFDRDENEDNVKNLKGMGLVNFEFFPHYKNSTRYDRELLSYSKTSKRQIYACPDGSGIVMNEGRKTFVGKCYCFVNGEKILL